MLNFSVQASFGHLLHHTLASQPVWCQLTDIHGANCISIVESTSLHRRRWCRLLPSLRPEAARRSYHLPDTSARRAPIGRAGPRPATAPHLAARCRLPRSIRNCSEGLSISLKSRPCQVLHPAGCCSVMEQSSSETPREFRTSPAFPMAVMSYNVDYILCPAILRDNDFRVVRLWY